MSVCASSSVSRASRWMIVYWRGGMEPSSIVSRASSASPESRFHSEKLMTLRAVSTSNWTAHENGATFAYHGHRVLLLWQSKQARTASSRVRGESHGGSTTVGGFECVRPYGTSCRSKNTPTITPSPTARAFNKRRIRLINIFYAFVLSSLSATVAGMILVGQLLAVFMSNAGGAWDNAKKMIEDEPKTKTTGKGSEKHKASVTGDTVGDPLKDTAGPAINPLIKVMNMVSLLALPLVIMHNIKDGAGSRQVGAVVLAIALFAVAWAWWQSKRETAETKLMDAEMEKEDRAAV